MTEPAPALPLHPTAADLLFREAHTVQRFTDAPVSGLDYEQVVRTV